MGPTNTPSESSSGVPKANGSAPKPSESYGEPFPQPLPTLNALFAETAQRYAGNIALISMHQPSDLLLIKGTNSSSSDLENGLPRDDRIPSQHMNGHATVTNRTSTADVDDRGDTSDHLRWTHGQLQHAAEVLARGLRDQGVRKGQPIATLLSNCVEWAISFRAAAALGCPFVPLNPNGVGNVREIEHMLKLSGTAVLVAGDMNMVTKLEQSLPDLVSQLHLCAVLEKDEKVIAKGWTSFYDLFNDDFNRKTLNGNGILQSEQPQEADDTALIIFTSGTTSLPKGAIYTNTTIAADLISASHALKATETSRACCHLPNHHIGGIQLGLAFVIAGGSTVYPSAGFDPAASVRALATQKLTNFPCVPAMLQAVAAQPECKTADTSTLRNVETGATTILLEHLRQVWTDFRCKNVTNGYGLTECGPVTIGYFDSTKADHVTVGSPVMGARLKICAPDSRIPVRRGEAGEVHVGGPQMIKGYLGGTSPESFYSDDQGRWFITGDQGIMAEDGAVTISGRYKDLIIRGGENIAPAAIEAVLDTKLGIMAQVVGVRSDVAGEVPIAVIQPKKDQVIVTTTIRSSIVEVLGPAFVPEKFYTLADLNLKDYPRTSSGKVRKVELKALVQKHEDALETDEQHTNGAIGSVALEDKLTQIWHKIIGIDIKLLSPNSAIQDLADSLTLMRLRNQIKRNLGLDVSTKELLEAATIAKQASLLSAKLETPAASSASLHTERKGPPSSQDIALSLGSSEITAKIQEQVTEAISPYGFTWENDVEDVLPSWDLGYEVFGSVTGTAKVNHRMSLSTKKASVHELHAALCTAIKQHSMQRSFELRGVNGEPTMRVIMRPNEKWFKYSIEEISEVEHPDELEHLLYQGKHFSEVEAPYPSFLVRIAHIKSTGTAGLIWALQHSAFDGLAMYTFLEDLDAALGNPQAPLKPHIPYKLWADMYYLHRSSLSAKRSVTRQISRLSTLSTHIPSIFPPLPIESLSTAKVTQRKTFIPPVQFVTLPNLPALRSSHEISPFILAKAALAIFLAKKTGTNTAIFSQNDNGRSWPFVEPWQQNILPDCMDLAGPTLERTVQIVPISPSDTVLSYLLGLKEKQDAETQDVHAPWNLVREGLGEARAVFDTVAMSTCLNYLPVRTQNGKVVFESMIYHETKANCETAWLFNCGIEGDGDDTRLWVQILSDDDIVSRENAVQWADEVMGIAMWLQEKENWNASLQDCEPAVNISKA